MECVQLFLDGKSMHIYLDLLPNINPYFALITLWCQLKDMFQLIVMAQGIEKVTIQLIDTPTKVYAIGARLFLSKVPLEVL